MKVLVFGANGQVGRALLALAGPDLVFDAPSRDRANLTDPDSCAAMIADSDADVVINAAAWTAVDAAEDAPEAVERINADAPIAMARACAARRLPFVHISSDYVLAGTGEAAQTEAAPLAPLSAYGRTKAQAEEGIAQVLQDSPYGILRTSWVFSDRGSNFVRTMLRLGQTRKALTVVADQIGGPTPATAIAQACIVMARAYVAGRARSGVYNFSGAPDVSWAGFAKAVFEVSGQPVKITPIRTEDYPTRAPRPLNSRLDCTKIAAEFTIERPDWRLDLVKVVPALMISEDGVA